MTAGAGKPSGTVGLFSALSAWSLIAFGVLSLLVVCFAWDWRGAFVGTALLVHGALELRLRSRFLPAGDPAAGKGLAWNQVALAGSVLLYLSWQLLSFDRSELDAILGRDPLRALLQQAPAEAAEMLRRDFPKLLAGAYGIAGFVVLVGCLGMALMYLKGRRK